MNCFFNHKRVTALTIAALVTAILFGSVLFILTHTKHHCTGEGCRVCADIDASIAVLHLLSEAVGTGAVIIYAYVCMKKRLIPYLAGLFLRPVSLVLLKIRLDN